MKKQLVDKLNSAFNSSKLNKVLTIKLNELDFIRMTHDEKLEAIKYVAMIKKALEMEGAIVLIS